MSETKLVDQIDEVWLRIKSTDILSGLIHPRLAILL